MIASLFGGEENASTKLWEQPKAVQSLRFLRRAAGVWL